MALYQILWDSATGKKKFSPSTGFVTQHEVVTGSDKTEFVISGITIDADDVIDAWVDGRKQIDTLHFNRNVGNNSIVFEAAVKVGSAVEIRTYQQ